MAGKLKRLATEKPNQVKISNFNEKITRNSQEQTINEKTSGYCKFKLGKKKKNSSQYKWILCSDTGFNKQGFQRDYYKYIQRFVATVKTLKRRYNGTKRENLHKQN